MTAPQLFDAILICVGFTAALSGPVIYAASGAKWWRNRIGRSRMAFMSVVTLLLSKSIITVAEGHVPAHPTIYSLFANTAVVAVLIYETYAVAMTAHEMRTLQRVVR